RRVGDEVDRGGAGGRGGGERCSAEGENEANPWHQAPSVDVVHRLSGQDSASANLICQIRTACLPREAGQRRVRCAVVAVDGAPAAPGLKALVQARRFVGVAERPPGSNRTPFGRWFGADAEPSFPV